MDPIWKHKWVDALRSGEYDQGTGQLRKDGKFCCLGVLTDLCIKEGLVNDWDEPDPGGRPYSEYDVTPDKVRALTGLSTANPSVPISVGDWITLAELNDGDTVSTPRTFEEIANVIEENL